MSSINTSLPKKIPEVAVYANEKVVRQVGSEPKTLLAPRSSLTSFAIAVGDIMVIAWTVLLQYTVPKISVAFVFQVDAGSNSTVNYPIILPILRLLVCRCLCSPSRLLQYVFHVNHITAPTVSKDTRRMSCDDELCFRIQICQRI